MWRCLALSAVVLAPMCGPSAPPAVSPQPEKQAAAVSSAAAPALVDAGVPAVHVDAGIDAGATPAKPAAVVRYRGVNLSGGEFGTALPGVVGTDYKYPSSERVDFFLAHGMNFFRVLFRWERLQREVRTPLNEEEWTRLNTLVSYITGKGATVAIVPYNSARFKDRVVTETEFGDFWGRVAGRLKDNSNVQLNLANEPHGFPTEQWALLANAGLREIRRVGFKNVVLVPGAAWSGARQWLEKFDGYTSNGVAMLAVTDPGNNMLFEPHLYLDAKGDGSGDCVSTTIGVERLQGFTSWARTNNKPGFLGEIGAKDTPTCAQAVPKALAFVEANADVWTGWAVWNSPVWNSATAALSIGPPLVGQPDRPQLVWLSPFLRPMK